MDNSCTELIDKYIMEHSEIQEDLNTLRTCMAKVQKVKEELEEEAEAALNTMRTFLTAEFCIHQYENILQIVDQVHQLKQHLEDMIEDRKKYKAQLKRVHIKMRKLRKSIIMFKKDYKDWKDLKDCRKLEEIII